MGIQNPDYRLVLVRIHSLVSQILPRYLLRPAYGGTCAFETTCAHRLCPAGNYLHCRRPISSAVMSTNEQVLADLPGSRKWVALLRRTMPAIMQPQLTAADLCQPTRSRLYVLVILIPNVITDVYLLSIPLPVCHPSNGSGIAPADNPCSSSG
jgi:hypothetical protein